MAIHTDAIAKVYAKSLYELADDAGGRDKIVELAEELEQICELARGDRTFREFLASPIINTKARGEAMRRIFHGRVTDLALRVLLVPNNKPRPRPLESISPPFDPLVHAPLGRIQSDLSPPRPFAPVIGASTAFALITRSASCLRNPSSRASTLRLSWRFCSARSSPAS